MKDSKCSSRDFKKDKKSGEKLVSYPKPWTQEVHDQYLKDAGISKKEHDEWHQQQKIN